MGDNLISAGDPLTDQELKSEDPQLDSIRQILFAVEQKRIRELEKDLQGRTDELLQLQAQIQTLQEELARQQGETGAIAANIVPSVTGEMIPILTTAVERSPDQLAELLGPIIGDAIRIHIRDERQSMIDALTPVMLQTVQRAIAEFARNLQRNIDARLKNAFGPRGFWRQFSARLRGISGAELAMRDSLPFANRQLFLIQNKTGLLLAHYDQEPDDEDKPDLIGGMLTAIRDFMRDSFGDGSPDQDLYDIQYGDAQIVIQNGQFAYIAAVIGGTEPEGFRDALKEFVAELHIQYRPQLRDFDGDHDQLPDFSEQIRELESKIALL